MEYVKIRDTSILVSKMALGTWVFSKDANWGDQDDQDSIKTLHMALDAGITLIDTATAYGAGKSEEIVGEGLKDRRSKAIIATKVADGHPDKATVISACEASLKRLQTDYIDIYQIHWPRRTVDFSDTMEGLLSLYKSGKIRAIGVSNFGVEDLEEMSKYGPIHTNQIAYNPLFRAIDHEIRDACIKKDIGILNYSALAQGLCTGKYSNIDEIPERLKRVWYLSPEYKHLHKPIFETLDCIKKLAKQEGLNMAALSIAYGMHKPQTASVLVGARNTDQLKENLKAANLKLEADIMDKMDKCTNELFNLMKYNADMWRTESAIR